MIKFERITAGMTLRDVHRHKLGNTTMSELGDWPVYVVSVDTKTRTAVVQWNGNREEVWSARKLERLYAKVPPSYVRQQERKAARGR